MPFVARLGDAVQGMDNHLVKQGPAVVMLPHPFNGKISQNVVPTVLINGFPVATVGSIAANEPAHVPLGDSFVNPPHNTGVVQPGPLPATVLVGGRPVALVGDPVRTCNDPQDAPTCQIITGSPDVVIG
jgi:uncharacterized Zn-binding protein involved in type VI secretion